MARPIKHGLEYFPLDVDFLRDRKILRFRRTFGAKGTEILLCLLCEIYRDKGYYVDYDTDGVVFDVANQLGCTENLVIDVISLLVKLDFFDSKSFEEHKILTSRRIQETYARAKRNVKISNLRFCVIDAKTPVSAEETPPTFGGCCENEKNPQFQKTAETQVIAEETPVSTAETPVNAAKSTQRKGKNIKVYYPPLPPLPENGGKTEDEGDEERGFYFEEFQMVLALWNEQPFTRSVNPANPPDALYRKFIELRSGVSLAEIQEAIADIPNRSWLAENGMLLSLAKFLEPEEFDAFAWGDKFRTSADLSGLEQKTAPRSHPAYEAARQAHIAKQSVICRCRQKGLATWLQQFHDGAKITKATFEASDLFNDGVNPDAFPDITFVVGIDKLHEAQRQSLKSELQALGKSVVIFTERGV